MLGREATSTSRCFNYVDPLKIGKSTPNSRLKNERSTNWDPKAVKLH